ncbi:MAG: prepilin-type N-terminal cleavage/methylation domain-containing protein [Betaproteobacteria bacterium]|nr:prepilin-type N-terminal cleavage/methylation domain-containing protein [Betaproteobacteria bacterium]
MVRARGFTLLEAMLVLVIIAIAYTLLPRMVFSGVSGAELRSSARAVATGLRMTRDKAIHSKREASLTLDLEQRAFIVPTDERPHKLHEQLEVKLFTAQADLVSDKVGSIRFYPDGSSNGGRVSIGAGGRVFEIDVDWLTGHVTVGEKTGDSRA